MAEKLARFVLLLFACELLIGGSPRSFAREDDPSLLNQRVIKLDREGKYREAIPIAEQIVATEKRVLGPGHLHTAVSLNNLALLYEKIGNYAGAGPLFEQALQIWKQVLGSEHPDTATVLNNLAELYRLKGEYTKAGPLFQQALQIREKMLGPEHPDTATSLNNLATLYDSMGDYSKAETLYQQALQINQKVLGPESPVTALNLNNLAGIHRDMGNYGKAEALYQQALQIKQKVLGPTHPETAASLNSLALLYEKMGNYTKTEPMLLQALQIRRNALGPEHPDTAESLDNLAALYSSMGNYAKAEPLYRQAFQIRKGVLGPEHPATAKSLNNLAELYDAMGKYAKALPLLEQALQTDEKVLGPEHPDTARHLGNLAGLYSSMGDYVKAEPLYRQAFQILTKMLGLEHPDTAQSMNNLAVLYSSMGDYAKAEPLYQQAVRIRKKVLGPEHPDTAVGLENLAAFYFLIGDYAKAEPLLEQALQIQEKVLGPDHPDTAISLEKLAVLYSSMGDHLKDWTDLYAHVGDIFKAEPLYQRAIQIFTKKLGLQHPETARCLSDLGILYFKMGDYPKAKPLLEQALRIRKKVLGPEHLETARSIGHLAQLYSFTGDYAKAEPLSQQALEILRKVLGPEHPETAAALSSLAALKIDRGEIVEARSLAQLSAKAHLAILSNILSFASEQERLAYEDTIYPFSLFAALKASEVDLASAILQYKGVVLDSIIEDRLVAEANKKSADRSLIERLVEDKRLLGQLLLQTPGKPSGESENKIADLRQEVDQIEGQLARDVSGLGRARRALTVTADRVQAVLPSDGALIEYIWYWQYLGKRQSERRYGAAVLTATGEPRWVPLGNADDLDAMVSRYKRLVRGAPDQDELSTNLEELYRELWAPVEQWLPHAVKRVIISPDGQLNFVSFATLLDSSERFLGEKYLLQYAASGRDLLPDFTPTASTAAIIFANPDFIASSVPTIAKATDESSITAGNLRGTEKRELQNLTLSPLEGTQREFETLARTFAMWHWETDSFTGKDATKEALLGIHSPYILHLATHGFFEGVDRLARKSLEQEPANLEGNVIKSQFFKNPMHRSGLALAGAQSTLEAWKRGQVPPVENDGIVTAEDVAALDLKGTWLVTLSACDTASGDAKAGEGVMGLRRGFMQAGAQNLLMTLWPISDESTVRMMSDFYVSAHNSGNAPEALAEVQRGWLVTLRQRDGLTKAVSIAGPFIMSSQGKPWVERR